MTGKIFLSYRRGDDAGFAHALFGLLEQSFPSDDLFMDVDKIPPGRDFVRELEMQVSRCDVLLAVIGKSWLGAATETGGRRLDDPNDFVRIEIDSALKQGKQVIPVLVNEARMPRAEELPEPLKPLARRNAVRLTVERFKADAQGLIKALQRSFRELDGTREAEATAARQADSGRRREEQGSVADVAVQREADEAAPSKQEEFSAAIVDEGLRAYMLRVYNYMAVGMALTGVVAYVVFAYSVTSDPALATASGGRIIALHRGMYLTPFGQTFFATPLIWLIILAPLIFVFVLFWRDYNMNLWAAQIAFWLFAVVMGASLSSIFLHFTAQSVTQVFFMTAAAFGALSLYGHATKKEVSGWDSFLIMGVIGILVAVLVNTFLQSSTLQFAISVIGVLVFTGSTAYDTPWIKDGYYEVAMVNSDAAIRGALRLYCGVLRVPW